MTSMNIVMPSFKNMFRAGFTGFNLMLLGDFDSEAFAESDVIAAVWLFIANAFLGVTVMLNLLIARMSDSYGRIQDEAAAQLRMLQARISPRADLLYGWLFCRDKATRDRWYPRWIHVVALEGGNAAELQNTEWAGVLSCVKEGVASSERTTKAAILASEKKTISETKEAISETKEAISETKKAIEASEDKTKAAISETKKAIDVISEKLGLPVTPGLSGESGSAAATNDALESKIDTMQASLQASEKRTMEAVGEMQASFQASEEKTMKAVGAMQAQMNGVTEQLAAIAAALGNAERTTTSTTVRLGAIAPAIKASDKEVFGFGAMQDDE